MRAWSWSSRPVWRHTSSPEQRFVRVTAALRGSRRGQPHPVPAADVSGVCVSTLRPGPELKLGGRRATEQATGSGVPHPCSHLGKEEGKGIESGEVSRVSLRFLICHTEGRPDSPPGP